MLVLAGTGVGASVNVAVESGVLDACSDGALDFEGAGVADGPVIDFVAVGCAVLLAAGLAAVSLVEAAIVFFWVGSPISSAVGGRSLVSAAVASSARAVWVALSIKLRGFVSVAVSPAGLGLPAPSTGVRTLPRRGAPETGSPGKGGEPHPASRMTVTANINKLLPVIFS